MEGRSLQELRDAVIGTQGTMVAMTFHRIIDQSRAVFQVVLRRGLGLVEENARLSLELSSALQFISSVQKGEQDAHSGKVEIQVLQQQLDAQLQELLYCRRKHTSDEAQIILASQTVERLEEKVRLSNAQYAQLAETHQALELRLQVDIETLTKAAALELERCKEQADATNMQLQGQLHEHQKQAQVNERLQQQLREELAATRSQLNDALLKVVQADEQVCQYEIQAANQSATIESQEHRVEQLQLQLHALELSLGEARVTSRSLSVENARLGSESMFFQDALSASHVREKELVVRLETIHSNNIFETASRALLSLEQHRLLKCQVEELQQQLSEMQSQLQEARRCADTATRAERDAASRSLAADSEILQLRRQIIQLHETSSAASSSAEAAAARASREQRQVMLTCPSSRCLFGLCHS
jgi:hypothetical protein